MAQDGWRANVHIHLERRLAHPRDAAYAWLTDFEGEDVARAGAVLTERRVLERGTDRAVYEGAQSVLGVTTTGTTEVTLHRPDRWEARVTAGPRKGSFTHYRIVPDGDGSFLTVDYHMRLEDARRHFALRLVRPLVRRELSKMWDGFVEAMDRELPRGPSSEARVRPQAQ